MSLTRISVFLFELVLVVSCLKAFDSETFREYCIRYCTTEYDNCQRKCFRWENWWAYCFNTCRHARVRCVNVHCKGDLNTGSALIVSCPYPLQYVYSTEMVRWTVTSPIKAFCYSSYPVMLFKLFWTLQSRNGSNYTNVSVEVTPSYLTRSIVAILS
ncbi:hypothetical protein EG68_02889 [Paragonimus skrjabini miyazakii]|uniref:Uncharacterized protein n=1 Tax=Paragonimus skrjabini miyazakii TaxID=59628 RepID=A0A8S9YWK0_9TREM|nr:hypothetical protein EG68_02889 [Paragonimus skrjabini miyazakii]